MDQVYAKLKIYSYNLYYLIISIIGCFLISFFAREFVGLFLSPRYFEAWIILSILIYANLFLESSALFRMALSQKKATSIIAGIVIITGLINLLLNWILISRWGMHGAAVATLLSGMILYFAFYRASLKWGYHVKVKWLLLSVLIIISIMINLFFWQLDLTLLTSLLIKLSLLLLCTIYFYYKYFDKIRADFYR